MGKSFSLSAIFLIILLSLRVISTLIMTVFLFFSPLSQYDLMRDLILMAALLLITITAFFGTLFKTRWGPILATIIAIIDMFGTLLFPFSVSSFGSIVGDLIIFILAIMIISRIKKKN